MIDQPKNVDTLVWFLSERAKELNCLYKIEEILNKPDASLMEICKVVVEAIPPGWQYPDICVARISVEGQTVQSPGFQETPWVQHADIIVQDKTVGRLSVYYLTEMPHAYDGPFLKEETKLLGTIVERLGHYILYSRMKQAYQEYQTARQDASSQRAEDWRVALNFLRQTNKNLFLNISRRMLNFLSWSGFQEAEKLLQESFGGPQNRPDTYREDENRPNQMNVPVFSDRLSDETFEIAAKHMSSEQILQNLRRWIQEDRLGFLVQATNRNLPLAQVIDAIRRYHFIAAEGIELPPANRRGILVGLVRRFLSDHAEFVSAAIDNIEIDDFYEILDRLVFSAESQGKLGGKSAGLFLAQHILKKAAGSLGHFGEIKVPKTWYIISDGLLNFLSYNNLNEIVEQKYKDINQVRVEYSHLVQTFKSCQFPTDIMHGLSIILDEFKGRPIIVRSSSLLEDRAGSSFSGKYKSLFLANQGSKPERLEALKKAVAEVYASTFEPDVIGYRSERGLLDFAEEMGVMIQEVVGTRIGDYFLPSFAGVAFSLNEFRWSPRIRREDGLLRLVPGLGTRAVDRTGDDYPVLIAPGQTDHRVNVTADEVVRYAPKKVDVINLKTNSFETIGIRDLLRECGDKIPAGDKIVSLYDGRELRRPAGRFIDYKKDDLVVTFDRLVNDTQFIAQLRAVMAVLEDKLRAPIDIEFASDGRDLYLLQCRPQSYSQGGGPADIPKDIPPKRILFLANRHISNGQVPDITHIVYVDPEGYERLANQSALLAVGRAVGHLNKLLPRRRFILMGPGRWGSRGDLRLGIRVSYSDISNTAVLIEIGREKDGCFPDLSFGTHFFQDIVEAEVRYIPLYPDGHGMRFQEEFFRDSPNILGEILPDYANLADVVKVIDVPATTGGSVLRILMNAEADEALGLLDGRRFGVRSAYVIGSTKNSTAGPQSDIDLLVHFRGTSRQRQELLLWLEGWSRCLDEMNFQKTGYRSGGLLDVHLITDKDIAAKTSFAVKIGAVADAARPLALKKTSGRPD